MSRNRHSRASEIAHLVADVKRTPADQVSEVHGITINENGTIFDISINKTFKNLNEWATDVIDEENASNDYDDSFDSMGEDFK